MKKVKDVMTKNVKTVQPSAAMSEAAKLMKKNRIGCLVAVDGKKPIGIVTERDIAYKILAEDKDAKTTVGEVMSKDLKTINGDASLRDAAKLMAAHLIRRLPVIEKSELVGIITIEDIMRVEKIGEDAQLYSYT